MRVTKQPSAEQTMWKVAIVDSMDRHERFRIFEYGLAECLLSHHPAGLARFICFLDPNVPCAAISGDPGWTVYRKPEVGEPHRHAIDLNEHLHPGFRPVPVPPPEAGAAPEWPSDARFFAEAMAPEDLGDPAYPEEYFTAAEVHEYIRRLMPVYAKYHPESQAQCERVLALSQWWVDHDAVKPPPAGAQTSSI